ncbi:MAG TPA: helix-turn-helix domain-containing protein [Rubrobacteraceae bacterium]|nr:helix-turn-helix domain-containing protein [Rubrobacteraceae bacterium]
MDINEPTTAQPDDEATGYIGEYRGEVPEKLRQQAEGRGEDSGWVSTKQAAKALGVSRRMVQEYVRRGRLEALTEGEGVSKTYYVSIDSLNALRERRGRRANDAPQHDEVSSGSSNAPEHEESSGEVLGEVLRETIERLETRAAEAAELKTRLELTAQAESSLREALEHERERADRLEAELREVRNPPSPEPPAPSEKGSEGAANTASEEAPKETQETLRRRSWLYRFFFGS